MVSAILLQDTRGQGQRHIMRASEPPATHSCKAWADSPEVVWARRGRALPSCRGVLCAIQLQGQRGGPVQCLGASTAAARPEGGVGGRSARDGRWKKLNAGGRACTGRGPYQLVLCGVPRLFSRRRSAARRRRAAGPPEATLVSSAGHPHDVFARAFVSYRVLLSTKQLPALSHGRRIVNVCVCRGGMRAQVGWRASEKPASRDPPRHAQALAAATGHGQVYGAGLHRTGAARRPPRRERRVQAAGPASARLGDQLRRVGRGRLAAVSALVPGLVGVALLDGRQLRRHGEVLRGRGGAGGLGVV